MINWSGESRRLRVTAKDLQVPPAQDLPPVRAALAQAVQLLRGKDVSVNDVRAAIEYTTGKNLAGTFRVWLYNPGVPSDFRSRYGATTENGKSKKGIRGDD